MFRNQWLLIGVLTAIFGFLCACESSDEEVPESDGQPQGDEQDPKDDDDFTPNIDDDGDDLDDGNGGVDDGSDDDDQAPINTGEKKIIDDFFICSEDFMTSLETYWYTYDDTEEPNNGTSVSERTLLSSGGYGDSECALSWTGTVTDTYEYGFAGLGMELGDLDMSGYSEMVLVVRGDGDNYRVKFPLRSQVNEFDYLGKNFSCGDGSSNWQEVRIKLDSLAQEGWGEKVDLDKSQMFQLQFQTTTRPISSFNCDLGLVYVI